MPPSPPTPFAIMRRRTVSPCESCHAQRPSGGRPRRRVGIEAPGACTPLAVPARAVPPAFLPPRFPRRHRDSHHPHSFPDSDWPSPAPCAAPRAAPRATDRVRGGLRTEPGERAARELGHELPRRTAIILVGLLAPRLLFLLAYYSYYPGWAARASPARGAWRRSRARARRRSSAARRRARQTRSWACSK